MATNIENINWYYEDGVPVRFTIKGLTIDLSEWKPKCNQDIKFQYANFTSVGLGLYGKCYELDDLAVVNSPGSGVVSVCSAQGGKKDFYLDSPESKINGLEIINTRADAFVFAGPHDSLLKEIICSHSKGKGVAIVADQDFSGACDIDFIHAYATDDIAIDINAKIKARFLQGDTGKKSGVRIAGSNKSIIDTVEVFKTRGASSDFSFELNASEAQIAQLRVRADAGAGGVSIAGFGNTISSLHLDANKYHSDFAQLNLRGDILPLRVTGNQNTVVTGRIYAGNSKYLITDEKDVRRFNCSLTVMGGTCRENYDEKFFRLSNINIDYCKV